MMPLISLKYRKYPDLVKTVANRHIMYNNELKYVAEEEAAGRLLVIRPESPIPVSRVEKDPEKLKQAYHMGRRAAEQRMIEILKFLGKTE